MKSIFLLASLPCLLLSCMGKSTPETDNTTAIHQKELELKQRELDLKERELKLLEKQKGTTTITANAQKKKRELRYLYYANGGLVGYFDDGTVAGCPRCDFCRSNILAMFKEKPHATYIVEHDGSLLVNNSDREVPSVKADHGWALVDYKWNEKVPQY